jgi:hypothetical protein
MAAMRAERNAPEWAQAQMMKPCEMEFIEELAGLFVEDAPIRRMAI